MRWRDLLATANHNLLRNKARTLLTILAIFIGATTLTLTNGIGSGIRSYLSRQVGDLGNSRSLTIMASAKAGAGLQSSSNGLTKYDPNQKKINLGGDGEGGAVVALTAGDIARIKTEPHITSVEPLLSVVTDYIAAGVRPNDKYQFSLDQAIGDISLDMAAGRTVDSGASDPEVTVPSSYASSLGFSNDQAAVGQDVTIGITDATGHQTSFSADIVGVQQKTLIGSTAAYANGALYTKLYDAQTVGLPANAKDAYTEAEAIYAAGTTDAQVASIKADLKREGYDAKTVKDQVNTVFTVISALTDVLDGFALITLIAAAFGIVNTLYMSVADRTKEIGLMKALGMGRRKIFALFSIEAALIGFWGSLLGVGFASAIGHRIDLIASHGFLKDFSGLQLLAFPAKTTVIIIGGIMGVAFLAGTLPARRASRKNPIEALRYE